MPKKFNYKFDKHSRILYKYFYGPINTVDIFNSWDHSFKNNLIPTGVKKFIVDFREANSNFKETDEYIKIVGYYNKYLSVFEDSRIAFISTNPNDLVFPMLIGSEKRAYSLKPFSTLEAAKKWVNS